jgi:hypothetical protein
MTLDELAPVRHFLRDKNGEEMEINAPSIFGIRMVHFFIDNGYTMQSWHKPKELYLGNKLIAVVWQETKRKRV